jgi:hypothetical protein
MTVESNDAKDNQEEESNDDAYWQTYFEAETLPMDAYRKRSDMACEHGNQQKQQAIERLEISKEKPKGPPPEFIFDR